MEEGGGRVEGAEGGEGWKMEEGGGRVEGAEGVEGERGKRGLVVERGERRGWGKTRRRKGNDRVEEGGR
eukprot:6858760-Lingulodinium_polyedra.AAC.1